MSKMTLADGIVSAFLRSVALTLAMMKRVIYA